MVIIEWIALAWIIKLILDRLPRYISEDEYRKMRGEPDPPKAPGWIGLSILSKGGSLEDATKAVNEAMLNVPSL